MAGPAEGRVPAIHDFSAAGKLVDDRDKPGHDDKRYCNAVTCYALSAKRKGIAFVYPILDQ